MGNYSQSYGTINASSLAAINSNKKWWNVTDDNDVEKI